VIAHEGMANVFGGTPLKEKEMTKKKGGGTQKESRK